MTDQRQLLGRSKMQRQRLGERRQFLAWEDHLHLLEDSRRQYQEGETEQEAIVRQEETVVWLHPRS